MSHIWSFCRKQERVRVYPMYSKIPGQKIPLSHSILSDHGDFFYRTLVEFPFAIQISQAILRRKKLGHKTKGNLRFTVDYGTGRQEGKG